MPLPFSKWLRLPSRVALLLGLGALSAAGAKADAPDLGKERMRVPQHSAKTFGELTIWNNDGRVLSPNPAGKLRNSGWGTRRKPAT